MSANASALSLRSRVIRAGGWTMGGHALSQLLRLASNLIMTRLLMPEMFGVMALANVLLVGLQLFSDIGLGQGIVQSRRGGERAYLNTVWTVQILRGGLIWLLALGASLGLYLLAGQHWLPAGSVYAAPELPAVIAALSFNALIGGFASTRLATASRNLALGRITLIEIGSQAIALALMVVWASLNHSIWALVGGSLLATALRVLASHTLLPGEPNRPRWDREALGEIFGFGKWIFLTSILGFLSANGDRLLLGGLVDPQTLGLYAIAFFMVSALQEMLAKISGNVAFPAFSEVVRERRDELKDTYYRFRLPVDVAALMATGLLLSAGHLLIDLLYDDRYLAAGHMIEILCIGLFAERYALAGQCFMALGLPKLLAPIIFIRILVVFGFIPVAFHIHGMDGALWIAGGSILFTLPLVIRFKIRLGLFDLKRELVVLPILVLGYLTGLLLVQAIKFLEWAA